MDITIFAATGGIGRQALDQALAAGHSVTAAVRSPRKLADYGDRIRTVTVNLSDPDPATVTSAIAGSDAVLSGLGATSTAEAGVAERGTRAIVAAMADVKVRRLVAVSAGPVGTMPCRSLPQPPKHDPGDGFFMRNLLMPVIKRALRAHYTDLAEMEALLRASDLDWTVIRPPRLTDQPRTGVYRTAYGQNVRKGMTIARADVADLMLRVLDDPQALRQTIGIAN